MTLANALQTLALAQAGSPAPRSGGTMDGLITIGGPLLMFLVIYLLLIRPASRQRKEHAQMLSALKKDDEVVTAGGIVGKVVVLEDKIATLEISDRVKVRIVRDRIVGRWASQTAAAAEKK